MHSGNIDGDAAFLVIPEINKLEDWHYKVIKDISALSQLTACNKINTQDFAASEIWHNPIQPIRFCAIVRCIILIMQNNVSA